MQQISPRARTLARFLGPALVIVGVAATLVGAGHVLGAVRNYFDLVTVPAYLTASDGSYGADVVLRVGDSGLDYSGAWADGVPRGGLPDRNYRSHPVGIITLTAPDATATEQLLSRADVLLRGLALLIAALALRPVLRALATGGSFRPGHDRRVRVVAGCVVVGVYVAPLVPWAASASVIARLPGATGISAAPPHHVEAFVVAALVWLVAAVVRAATPEPSSTSPPAVPDLDGLGRAGG